MAIWTKDGAPWLALLKLGEREHLEKLRKGEMYMNSLSYFAKLEADGARSDQFEGTDYLTQPSDVLEFVFNPNIKGVEPLRITAADLAGPARIALHRTSACNICCFFAIDKPFDEPMFADKHEWFGSSMMLFTHTPEFLSRVISAAQKQNLPIKAHLVEYYDETKYTGPIGVFRKRSQYSHQCEYRIQLHTGSTDPFILNVGDLSDITSEILPFSEATNILKFSSIDMRDAGLTYG